MSRLWKVASYQTAVAIKKIHMQDNHDIEKLLTSDLSIRENNPFFGSKFGGNASHLLFLLTHPLQLETNDADTRFECRDTNLYLIHRKIDVVNTSFMVELRTALADFLKNTEHQSCSFEQLVDVNFLKSQPQTPNIQSLINCLEYYKPLAQFAKENNGNYPTVEDILRIKSIKNYPSFAQILVLRLCVGIATILKFDLDMDDNLNQPCLELMEITTPKDRFIT